MQASQSVDSSDQGPPAVASKLRVGGRLRLRFALRTSLVGFALTAVPLAWIHGRCANLDRQAKVIDIFRARGIEVQSRRALPDWLFGCTGFRHNQTAVCLTAPAHTGFSDRDAELLVHLRSLETCHLDSSELSDEGMQWLANLPIKWLALCAKRVTSRGLSSLPHGSLTRLDLTEVSLESGIWAHVGKCRNLKYLTAHSADLRDGDVAHIRHLTRLELLSLSASQIGPETLRTMASLPRLMNLYLTNVTFADGSLAALGNATSLEHLFANGCELSDSDAQGLANSPRLRVLMATQSVLSDRGLISLAGIESLDIVCIPGSQVTSAGQAAMFALRPDVDLVLLDSPPAASATRDQMLKLGGTRR